MLHVLGTCSYYVYLVPVNELSATDIYVSNHIPLSLSANKFAAFVFLVKICAYVWGVSLANVMPIQFNFT